MTSPHNAPFETRVLGHSSQTKKIKDPVSIEAVDYIEIFAANARQAAYYYSQAFGFTPVAYRGPETGYRDAATYVLRQNKVTFVITSPLSMRHWMSAYVMVHGDTAKDIAFRVADCDAFYEHAIKQGAKSAEPPTEWEDENGTIKRAGIYTYGETIHSIVERKDYKGTFWPGFVPYKDVFPEMPHSSPVGLITVDHVVGNVELGQMETWVKYYSKVLGFTEMKHFTDDDISTEYSALMSKVMTDGKNKIKFPINEPAQGKRKSQIDEYLEFHEGPGVQHVALITNDIIKTVSELKQRGVQFLNVPKTYYEELSGRVGKIKEDIKKLAELGILVDRDDDGYLLQLFTKPVHDRPTLFFEIIQRRGSKGFGVGNFKALFQSIEREQEMRGNL